jgi:hypothetical protein
MGRAQAAYSQVQQDAKIPIVPPTVPHSRLLNMIAGIGVALSAAGTSVSSHGREGGAPEVQQYYANQQQQKIQAQEAAQAQKNAKLQQDLMVADTNEKVGQNILYMSTIHNQMTQSDLDVQGKQQQLTAGALANQTQAQDMFDSRGQVPQGWGVDPNSGQVYQLTGQSNTPAAAPAAAPASGAPASPSGVPASNSTATPGAPATTNAPPLGTAAPAAGQPATAVPQPATASPSAAATATPSIFNMRQGYILDAAGKELQDSKGNDDPVVAMARKTLADPNSTPQQKRQAVLLAQNKAALSADAVAKLTAKADLVAKQQSTDPLFKLETDPSEMEGAKSSAAVPMLKNMIATETDPDKKVRETRLLAQATSAHRAYLSDMYSAENAKVLAEQGNVADIGKALAAGDVTLADLKTNKFTPGAIAEAIDAAKKINPSYNATNEIVGEQALKEPGNQVFYGSARSLAQPGGMLDQLKAAHDALGNTKIPALNTYSDWLKYQAGSPALATYRAAVLGAADDYAKVIGGGTPTDSARQASADTFIYNLNQGQFDGVVDQSRENVKSQVKGRIGTNGYVQQREGDILQDSPASTPAPAGSAASKVHANLGDFKQASATQEHGILYTDDGKTWYTSDGSVYGGQ